MDLHNTCVFVLGYVELAQRHGCTLEVMASTKVKSFLVDFLVLAGIKICMYEPMCYNARM